MASGASFGFGSTSDSSNGVFTLSDGSLAWVDAQGRTIHQVTANDPHGNPVTFQEIIDANGNRKPNMDDPATAKAFGSDLSNYLSDPGNHVARTVGNDAVIGVTSLVGLGPVANKIM